MFLKKIGVKTYFLHLRITGMVPVCFEAIRTAQRSWRLCDFKGQQSMFEYERVVMGYVIRVN